MTAKQIIMEELSALRTRHKELCERAAMLATSGWSNLARHPVIMAAEVESTIEIIESILARIEKEAS